ncbi:hypothetical protein CCHR01_15144 [Colletotrichum chrysophilum]|uniref:Uncharacterized protein n=1 Tax=Colletotrichum chrysophilum TaxID=1836956 RepID=A0AAD9EEU9_9PEZI|nr:hypothetical protein CCHR01_15144 [Colletotrichum chrysophilum]
MCVCACLLSLAQLTRLPIRSLRNSQFRLGLRTPLMPISHLPCVVRLRSPADEHQQIGAGELSCAPPSYSCCA